MKKKEEFIYLLSIEEYEKYINRIPQLNICWWLRAPGKNKFFSSVVTTDRYVYYDGFVINHDEVAIRPALNYSNIEISESKEADCFIWNEVKWKIIDQENKIAIAYLPITFRRFDGINNTYKTSEVRHYLLKWFDEAQKN